VNRAEAAENPDISFERPAFKINDTINQLRTLKAKMETIKL